MRVDALDHLVLTVRNIPQTIAFYERVLGMTALEFAPGRHCLRFGQQKINLHPVGSTIEPKAAVPTPGGADLCFLTSLPLEEAMEHVRGCGVEVIEGPVGRLGATADLRSFYLRDPSGNLIEVANVE